jgi:hypothetical protein
MDGTVLAVLALLEDAKAQGRTTVRLTCRRHGETKFVLEGRGYYRCLRSLGERVNPAGAR